MTAACCVATGLQGIHELVPNSSSSSSEVTVMLKHMRRVQAHNMLRCNRLVQGHSFPLTQVCLDSCCTPKTVPLHTASAQKGIMLPGCQLAYVC
jgi:hypothetical protein